jgi:antitoxin CptB
VDAASTAGQEAQRAEQAPNAQTAEESRRLQWRCRRGTKELDVLLERYASGTLAAASAPERHTFMQLLELPDPLLTEYLLGWVTPDEPALADLVRRIRATPPRSLASPPSSPLGGGGPGEHAGSRGVALA